MTGVFQLRTSCLVNTSTRSSSYVFSLLGSGWYSRARLSFLVVGVGSEIIQGGCSSKGQGRLGPGGQRTKEEGDVGGEGSGELLVVITGS